MANGSCTKQYPHAIAAIATTRLQILHIHGNNEIQELSSGINKKKKEYQKI